MAKLTLWQPPRPSRSWLPPAETPRHSSARQPSARRPAEGDALGGGAGRWCHLRLRTGAQDWGSGLRQLLEEEEEEEEEEEASGGDS
jgi:hypothetical protein